jgi:hypothetical protein
MKLNLLRGAANRVSRIAAAPIREVIRVLPTAREAMIPKWNKSEKSNPFIAAGQHDSRATLKRSQYLVHLCC